MITLSIDGKQVKAEPDQTVLQAALNAGIYIPNLCYHPELKPFGGCRMCVVEVEGMRGYPTACTTAVAEGMKVKTVSPKLEKMRLVAIELLLANHPANCLECQQNMNCELQAVAQYMDIDEKRLNRLKRREKFAKVNTSNPLFEIDLNKCILCGRCVRACYELKGAGVLSFVKRGRDAYIGTAFDVPLMDANCVFCRTCVEVCPTGALSDKRHTIEKGKTRDAMLVPCRNRCPAGIDIPRYIRFITEGKYPEALAVIREKVPLPSVLGSVCFHPCEGECLRNDVNEPISINGLKRYAFEHDNGLWKKNAKKASPTGKKVAVIGAGPAGLTGAFYLAKKGHQVTIFEALPVVGGMTRVGIPEYRLPRSVLDKDVQEIKNAGVEIKTNTKVESLDEIFSKGYNAVLVAIGAFKGSTLGVEGDTHVIEAINFLQDVALGKKVKIGKKVAVVGCGNVAIDAARTALRVGAKEVTILYRRTQEEAPANDEEIKFAEEEGVKFNFLTAPCKIEEGEGGCLDMECTLMELGEKDASGRPKPVPKKGSEFTKDYDTIIAAIGQAPDVPANFKIETDRARIKVSSNTATTREGVFAAGDAASGPLSVIDAIAGGRKAASAIDKFLGGDGNIDEALAPVETPSQFVGMKEGFGKLPRCQKHEIPIAERMKGFAEVEHGFDNDAAAKEAYRCLQCDSRTRIASNAFPPKRKSTKGSAK